MGRLVRKRMRFGHIDDDDVLNVEHKGSARVVTSEPVFSSLVPRIFGYETAYLHLPY